MVFKLLAMYLILFPTMTACRSQTPDASAPADEAPVQQVIAEPPPATINVVEDEPGVPPPVNPVDELLDALEASAADLESFTANISYTKYEELLGRREKRMGRLVYSVDPATGKKRFAALFDRQIVNRRSSSRLRHYVFDGRWLAEIDHESHSFVKREIVAPGRELDPLKLGEGPFPLPIGQPKADVLARFSVDLFTPEQGSPLADVAETFEVDGLLLIPWPGTPERDEYERVELLYDRVTRLPVGVNVIQINGDRKTVILSDPVRNPLLDEAAREDLRIEEPDPERWRIDVRPWQP